MARVNVECQIDIYEVNGEKVQNQKMIVKNYWNENSKVVLEINGADYTIVADDLKVAIENAKNTGR